MRPVISLTHWILIHIIFVAFTNSEAILLPRDEQTLLAGLRPSCSACFTTFVEDSGCASLSECYCMPRSQKTALQRRLGNIFRTCIFGECSTAEQNQVAEDNICVLWRASVSGERGGSSPSTATPASRSPPASSTEETLPTSSAEETPTAEGTSTADETTTAGQPASSATGTGSTSTTTTAASDGKPNFVKWMVVTNIGLALAVCFGVGFVFGS